ncbi:energy transducer TonB family protein [Rhodomicrobium vannielii]|uniref:energy transducer TonB family protein n=1 Tax=Rhodomicrobium vannielii TaxID=1069 RepID=UPI003CCF1FE7
MRAERRFDNKGLRRCEIGRRSFLTQGAAAGASLRKPSGHRDLDAEALDLVRRASPLPLHRPVRR